MGLFNRKSEKIQRKPFPGESLKDSPDTEKQLSDTVAESDAGQHNNTEQLSDTVAESDITGKNINDGDEDLEAYILGGTVSGTSKKSSEPEEIEDNENYDENEKNESDTTCYGNEDKKTELLNIVLDHFIVNEGKLLSKMQSQNSDELRNLVLKKAREQFKIHNVKGADLDEMTELFKRYMWGYYILDPLIEDRSIFDIKCYSADNIRIKRMGQRMAAPENIKFTSEQDYIRFVRITATKNQINLSVINALATFTDKTSSSDFIMRFDISTEFVNSSQLPVIHIRKIPKIKYTMEELVELGFMTQEQRKYFEEKAVNSGGILFTGSGGSGKTTFMNSLLELYPHDKSGLVIQENEELFSNTHPDINFQHVIYANGEAKVKYDLKTLSRQGLLNDIDLFVIGEIKGDEAASLAMCSYTGAQAWCSCHGKDEVEAIYKLADYVKQGTGYSLNESLKMLSGLEVIVFLKNFKVEGVSEIKGWDYEDNTLIIEKKYFSDCDNTGQLSDTVAESDTGQLSDTVAESNNNEYADYLKMLI